MMAIRNESDFLKAELLQIQRLRKMLAAHPLMSEALACRERELREQLCRKVTCANQQLDSRVDER